MSDNIDSLKIADLLRKKSLLETDILIVEDSENTKHVTLKDLILSIIKDNETPANFRLYSSEKVNSLVSELSKTLETELGKVNGGYEEVLKKYATSIQLEELKTYVNDELEDKIDEEVAMSALDEKRDKKVLLTAADFDTSSDDYKIKIENLATEVISAMTGQTSVAVATAPKSGWLTEDIADNAIIAAKLSDSFRFVKHMISGSLNDLTKDGIYILGPNVEDLPKMDESDEEIRIIDVRNANNYIIQTVYYSNDYEERPIYRRKCNINRLHVTDFVKIHEVTTQFKIGRDMLKEEFNNNGVISSGNVYTYRDEGHYYMEVGVEGLPTYDSDYLVEVRKYNDYYIYTAEKISTTECILYHSVLYFQAGYLPINSQWYTISETSKSKFDGAKVYLIGDGTLFGSGSSDITTKSVGAILTNKYGMVINNRSLTGATFGNYGDDTLAEYSVLKQIESTDFSNAEYVIILAGTEDWRSEISDIGSHDDKYTTNDITYKGSIALAIKNILEENPSIKLLFCTPIFRSRINYGDSKNSDQYTINDVHLSEYADAMVDICKAHHVPVLNLYENSMINRYTADTYLRDGLNLNDAGNSLLADEIVSGLSFYY